MKKYLLGLTAVVLAIGFSAFTTTKFVKPFATKTFKLRIVPTQQSDLTVLTNWEEGTPTTCDGTNEEACLVTVDERDVQPYTAGGTSHLGPANVTITAATFNGLTTSYFVNSIGSQPVGHIAPTKVNQPQ